MEASGSRSKIIPELTVVNGASSGEKTSVPVDPRWPLLNRWSVPKDSKFATAEIPPFVPKDVDASSSSLVADNVGVNEVIEDEIIVEENQVANVHLPSPGDRDPLKHPTFSSYLGAWKRPLTFPSTASHQESEAMNLHEPNNNSAWPPLSRDMRGNKSGGKPAILINDVAKFSENSDAQLLSLKAHSKDYPWAARMNQSLRNLHRVTIPEYMEDGTPKVRIPSHVLLGGLENQKEFVVGQFYRCLAPSGGQIQAVVTRIWGRKCRIFTRKLGESTYLFHIPDESTRNWVIQRGLWHVDDCLMFVSSWSPSETISVPEITTVPVWLTLLNIPDQLYSILGIKWIASGIGEPLLTEKPWLDPTQMGKAKILVEVKLDKPFPKRVALLDKSDSITMVDVLYTWLPSTCSGCGQLGHKASRCLLLSSKKTPPLGSKCLQKNDNIQDDDIESKHESSAQTRVEEADVSNSSSTRDSGELLCKETLKSIEKTKVLVSPISEEKTTSPVQVGTPINSPTTLSLPEPKNTTSTTSPTTKGPSNEANIYTHITPSSENADKDMRRSLSSLALSANRFASLHSSDDDVSDDDIESPGLNDVSAPVEFLTPFAKRILRERPVKPSEKVKERHWQEVPGGRNTRGRGKRGGRG